ncbi:glutathione transferase GstA [Pelomonas sp. Root1237]|uniref:glutathione transferase GstA n=1 Tax=Pelomonas sp. Root1237 TaxID=1736434 RepID=UPI0006F85A1A|nr:glutathione transferase GstA [Pelomonas sp. Root1237]KQV95031.1 glutathione S-transferase [Pelomonas sp. Root1237]
MKLYFAPGACSLCPHIVVLEAGLTAETVQVNLKAHQLLDGSDYYAINSRGYVPLLELDDGQRITENAAIVQYLAERAPDRGLLPPAGTLARTRVQEWLAFVGSELHKGFSPLFNPALPEEARPIFKKKLLDRFGWVNQQLAGKSYLMGEAFTVADAYLFVITGWAGRVGVDIAGLENLAAHQARTRQRPEVQAALQAEGQA